MKLKEQYTLTRKEVKVCSINIWKELSGQKRKIDELNTRIDSIEKILKIEAQ